MLSLLLSMAGGFVLLAQTYDFQNFTVENGLTQSQALSLYQDRNGELWIGTNAGGINRFDGSGFTYLNKAQGLSDNTVFAFADDTLGRLLIGTNDGITVIDGLRTDTITKEDGLTHEGVHSLLLASDGTLWAGTRKGVCIIRGMQAIPFDVDADLSASTVLGIREGADGTIWFSTVQHGAFGWNGVRMRKYSTERGLYRSFVYDIMPIGPEEAWIFGHDALYHLINDTATVINVPLLPPGTTYFSWHRDRADNIWMGTARGVLKFDGEDYLLLTKANGLVDNNIWKLMQDREGNIWFASKSLGVSKLNSERFKLYNSPALPDLKVNAVLKDRKGQMWLGTNKGLVEWDGKNEYIRYNTLDNGMTSDEVNALAEDWDGNILVATRYGVSVYDGKKFKEVYADEQNLNRCLSILVDGYDIWLGTQAGVGKMEPGRIVQPEFADLYKNFIFHACRRDDGLWFAYEDGLLHYTGRKFHNLRAADGFADGRTRSVISGPDGDLWFGTNDGIFRWNGDTLVNITQKDGLLSNSVYSLAFDAKGNLWAGQSKGICKLAFSKDGTFESVMRYGRDQGFLGLDCAANSIFIDENDVVWVGTSNGLVSYDPRLDKGEFFSPITRILDIKLFSQTVNWALFSDSVLPSGLPFDLKLPYDRNHLTFEFSGVTLTSPTSINYIYMLEGFDEDWSPITNKSEATYANLPPGQYVFKVRAGYGNDIWTNEPVDFRFVVRPPFWNTWWFYMLCGLAVIGVAYSYFTIRRANVKITRQNAEIEKQRQLVEEKKDEIEKKNREMLDSINYASNIQSAVLPADDLWLKALPESFVLFLPKDIVSGDFYWMVSKGEEVFFAAVDCTGHGVPGALMSIVGANGLNQAVKEQGHTQPSEILNYLNRSVNDSLQKTERSNYVRDGMDLALCRLNLAKRTLCYAGAYNPLVIIRDGEATTVKADRIAIGSLDTGGKSYTDHHIDLQPGDNVYVFSDGYVDQFGGADGKKLKSRPMIEKLIEYSHLPMSEQRQKLHDFFLEWRGPLEQIDDVCLIGVRV